MRKSVVLIVFLLSCASLGAQHWLGASADGYLSWPTKTIERTKAKISGGTAIDVRYQFQKNHFTLETGVGVSYHHASYTILDSLYRSEQRDDKGQEYIHNVYKSDRLNVAQTMSVHLPLMVGVDFDYIYAQAGVIANLRLRRSTCLTERVATTGEYDLYYEPLEDMPNHGFHTSQTEQTRTVANDLVPDVRVTAEIGTVLYPFERNAKYRIGVFAEYGLFNEKDIRAGIRLTAFFSLPVRSTYRCRCDATATLSSHW